MFNEYLESRTIEKIRSSVGNMRQGNYFALVVAAFLLTVVLVQTVNLTFGMLIHELSVLSVVINAVRLLAYGDNEKSRRETSL